MYLVLLPSPTSCAVNDCYGCTLYHQVAAKQAANTEAKVSMLTERVVYLEENRTTDEVRKR